MYHWSGRYQQAELTGERERARSTEEWYNKGIALQRRGSCKKEFREAQPKPKKKKKDRHIVIDATNVGAGCWTRISDVSRG